MPDIVAAIDTALRKHQLPTHPLHCYPSFVGSGLREAARRSLPEELRGDQALLDRVHRAIQEAYREKPVVHTRPYPGVVEMIKTLKQKGLKLAIITNKDRDIAQGAVDILFPDNPFDLLVGVDQKTAPKPDLAGVRAAMEHLGVSPDEVLMVGDSEADMQTGKAGGFALLAVSWGYRSLEELKAAGAEHFAETAEAIISFVEEQDG